MRRRDFIMASAGLAATAASGAALAAAPAKDSRTDVEAARLWAAERRFLDTSFGRIAYVDRGAGPAVLFLHGFPLNGFQWRGAVERLSARRRCLAPDSMGLGYTEPAAGQDLAPAAQARMLEAFLDRLGVEQVDLIASDSGGAVAQLFMAGAPQRVRTLLLTNCDVEPDSPPPALKPVIEMAHAGTYPDKWLAPWLADKALARSPAGLGGICYTRPDRLSDATIETYLAPLVRTPERKALVNAYAIGLEINPLAGLEPRLRRCFVPTRVVWGMSDDIFSSRNPDYLAGVLPNFRGVRRIPEAKLFFPEEYPDLIAGEALKLWA